MENKNPIIKYLADLATVKDVPGGGYGQLIEYGEEVNVTLADVAFALEELLDHYEAMMGASHLLQECRLQAIVANLDEETQEKILNEFREVGDDLFEGDTDNDNK